MEDNIIQVKFILKYMERNGLSAESFASLLGMSEKVLHEILNDNPKIKITDFIKLARFMGVSIDRLVNTDFYNDNYKKFLNVDYIKNYMRKNEIKKADFAKECGLSVYMLDKILYGYKKFDVKVLQAIAKAMNVKIGDIINQDYWINKKD